MRLIPGTTTILAAADLAPHAWSKDRAADGHFFNPAIVQFYGRLLFAYRVVPPDGSRRIAICELESATLSPRRESIVPLSDFIEAGGTWHADPRFCTLGARLFLHYNDGWRIPNQIFLLELDPDRLVPLGPARPLLLDNLRSPVEKNWMLFEHGGELFAVYRIAPHTILHVDLDGRAAVNCRRLSARAWNVRAYARWYGEPRGGTPPIAVDGVYYAFFHSVYPANLLRRLAGRLMRRFPRNSKRYAAGFYGFDGTPPFRPLLYSQSPVLIPERSLPRRRLPPLWSHVKDVVYPSGAVWAEGKWIVSYGARDEYCCIKALSHSALLNAACRNID